MTRSRLLPEGEPEISEALVGYLGDEGVRVRTGLSYRRIRRTGRGITLEVEMDGDGEALEAEARLAATGAGRTPAGSVSPRSTWRWKPAAASGSTSTSRPATPKIYATGDVTGRYQFVHMAAYGAKLAALNALNGDSERYDAIAMPMVTFTDPQVASVGMTEAAARAAGHDVKISILPLDAVPRALAARNTRGLIKLVADRPSDRLLGAHILAPEGAVSIQTAALAIKRGMTVRELGETIFPYLTTVERLKLADQTFDKDVKKLSCCAG